MKHIVFFLILSMVLVGCEDKDPPSLIVVTTGEATNITFESAKVNVDLSDTKGVKEIGVVYSTDKDFATSQTVKVEESLFTKGGFNLTDLLSQTTYYYKGFAADGLKNMVYGKVKEFITKESTLSVSPSQINADYKEGEYQFQITTESEWIVTSNQTWCTVDKTSGKGETTITIHVTENVGFEERNALISVIGKDFEKNVAVHQALQSTFLALPKSSLLFQKEGGKTSITVNCNKQWVVSSDQSWCTVFSNLDNNELVIETKSNTSLIRSAVVTVMCGEITKQLPVNQLGISTLDTSPSLVLSELAILTQVEGGIYKFNVSCESSWKVKSDQSWCIIQTSSGVNNGIVKIKVDNNPYETNRFATITVESGNDSQMLLIGQIENTLEIFNQDTHVEYILQYSAQSNSSLGIVFKDNKIPLYSCDQDWCKVFETPESWADIGVRVEKNVTNKNRIAIIECISSNDIKVYLIVTQYAKSSTEEKYAPDIEMVFVEGGSFIMGGEESNSQPKHKVTLNDYYIGKYEVTQSQWDAIMDDNPSHMRGKNLPVERVTWNQVEEFITKLNNLSEYNYRLPTEAEWEYAARGGKNSKGYKYSGSDIWQEVGVNNYVIKTRVYTYTCFVGSLKANELGIYDMTGNVSEWCNDWDGPYSAEDQINPMGPINGRYRIERGVLTNSVSYRSAATTNEVRNNLGFRLVRTIK